MPSLSRTRHRYPRVRRLDRDVFVALGGPELLVEVLRRPQSPADARLIPASVVKRDSQVWNITLYILRELCFTDQDLSERCGVLVFCRPAHPPSTNPRPTLPFQIFCCYYRANGVGFPVSPSLCLLFPFRDQ